MTSFSERPIILHLLEMGFCFVWGYSLSLYRLKSGLKFHLNVNFTLVKVLVLNFTITRVTTLVDVISGI